MGLELLVSGPRAHAFALQQQRKWNSPKRLVLKTDDFCQKATIKIIHICSHKKC